MSHKVDTGEHPLDLLRRIGDIGAMRATASLSALAGKPFENSYAKVRILPVEEVPALFGDPEETIAAVIFSVGGEITGQFIAVFPIEDALELVGALTGSERSLDALGDMQLSALAEVGNILASSYLGALERTTGLELAPSPPVTAVDMAAGILTTVVLPMHEAGSEILLIEARFGGGERELEGRMILLPSTLSLPRLLRSAGDTGKDG